VHCCNGSNDKEDGHMVERWNKEYGIDEDMRVLVFQLRCVSMDSFENSCFVVEDKSQLFGEVGTDVRKLSIMEILWSREKGWAKEFYPKKKNI